MTAACAGRQGVCRRRSLRTRRSAASDSQPSDADEASASTGNRKESHPAICSTISWDGGERTAEAGALPN